MAAPALLAALAACGENDDVARYRVTKLPPAPSPAAHAHGHDGMAAHPGIPAAAGPRRILAAIIPHNEQTWFLKLEGPAEEVGRHVAAFDRFLRSVKLSGPEPAWDLPPGWRQEAGTGMRFATLLTGGEGALPLTVMRLGGDAGGVLANVQRWAGQVGAGPVTAADLGKVTTEVPLDVARALRVDLTGEGGSAHAMTPGATPAPVEVPAPAPPFRYEAPSGWTPAPGPSMSVLTLAVTADGGTAKVTAIPLGGAAGGLTANVNRWRGQIGLPPADEATLKAAVSTLEISGSPASCVSLPFAGEPAGAERILGAVLPRGETTWFFKMQGPEKVVETQRAAFEAFLKSMRFE